MGSLGSQRSMPYLPVRERFDESVFCQLFRVSPLDARDRPGLFCLEKEVCDILVKMEVSMGLLKIEGVTHWSIPVNDLTESEEFYGDLLGLKPLGRLGDSGMSCFNVGD